MMCWLRTAFRRKLMGAMPGEKSAFGDVEKAAAGLRN
ncbi:Uncharacterised protein [Escherichia coli]|uniref:Uncharacterized protein n=1 Tax=Escherichia coli TaxID=562 RepID=A0A376P9F6_ECOLX|nr:Uncharacterised protein [Escherichia coli]